jgi:primosomal protein N' (replication factor Y)
VALDVPLAKLFDYAAPDDCELAPGDRVAVPFGARQEIGVVIEANAASELSVERIKRVAALRDDAPRLPREWLELMRFLSVYYQRPLGETIIASLPPRLRSVRPLPKKALAQADGLGSVRFSPSHSPTADQTRATEAIAATLGSFRAWLLHGVTGSGKTEVYLHVIARVLESGGQALVLVPEISLTPQLEARFREAFPEARIAMLHSALEDVARTSAWLAAARGDARIVLGTRLAVLAPLPKLALIIVDEEHDSSFKQQEGLRYSARDVAVYRAKARGCPVVLGTATPSLETWHNWRQRRYERLELAERAAPGAKLPTVRTVDLRADPAEDGFAKATVAAIGERLARGEQSLVFINRRGYAPVLSCEACGWAASCGRCTAHLVLHAKDRCLRCHHCGAQEGVPRACPTCGNVDLQPLGRGTQRVEEGLQAMFPEARILRIDADSTRRKGSAQAAFDTVHRGEVDILVGTQMVAKGHDFKKLTLVGVLNPDTALFSQDYRASERLFAQLMQVAGRAGRAGRGEGGSESEVLVQTRYASHPLYSAVARHDYDRFAGSLLAERKQAALPPYMYQALLRAEARELADAIGFLEAARDCLLTDAVTINDPIPMTMTRVHNVDRAQLLVESPSRPALQGFLKAWLAELRAMKTRVRWSLEVDPLDI